MAGSATECLFWIRKIKAEGHDAARIHGNLFAAGSRSTCAHAILDTERRKEMTSWRRGDYVGNQGDSSRHVSRHAFCGGFINVCVINEDG